MLNFFIKKIFGSVNERYIRSLQNDILRINSLETEISALNDEQLRGKTAEFKNRLTNGASCDSIIHESFAVVREAAKRTLNMRHFDVQLVGGMVLHQGKIAEMRTGEGKTLVATLPSYLNALLGKGVHIVTVNDYLAKRDAEWMGQVHRFLGLEVGCITNDLSDFERKMAYACDITYATNNELGFDYLRDNMKYDQEQLAQRGRFFAIVDEVDSILIDEARTPLIISGPTEDNSDLYQQIDLIIPKLENEDFIIEEKERVVFLSEVGIEKVEKLLKNQGVIAQEASLFEPQNMRLAHHVNQALKAHKIFKNEIDYIVKDGGVVIIDEFTGRMQEGRRFSDGLHQALEAKEGLKVRNENQTLASISFQNYFRLYEKLSGMTGTAMNEAVELEEIYRLQVVEIPTNRSVSRIDEDDELYKSEDGKYRAIVNSVSEAYGRKQPILLGTTSIEKSEYLSKLLLKHKLPHTVLNAKYHEKEAEIIAQAGSPGAITIATNMAGRGTDIMLGGNFEFISAKETNPDKLSDLKTKIENNRKTVIEAGGLYVLGTERHESRRIDNQLRGRSGRQGDPGRSKFFLSFDDDLLRIFGSQRMKTLFSKLGLKDDEAIFHPMITKSVEASQRKVESHNYDIRKNLLKYDDVVNMQRKSIYELRNEVITSTDISKKLLELSSQIISDLLEESVQKNTSYEQISLDLLEKEFFRIFGQKIDSAILAKEGEAKSEEISVSLNKIIYQAFKAKEEEIGIEKLRPIQKHVFLVTLDSEWKDHLLSLDKMRQGINLRSYAQKDPLTEFRHEAFELFEAMMMRIEEQVLFRLLHVQLAENKPQENSYGKRNKQNQLLGSANLGQNSRLSGKKSEKQNFITSEAKPVKPYKNTKK